MLSNLYGQPAAGRAVGLGAPLTGNKSADTRFNNSLNKAKGLIPASNSVVNKIQNNSGQGPTGYNQNPSAVTNLSRSPSVVSSYSEANSSNLDTPLTGQPVIEPEDLAFEYFLSSPEVQEALSKAKLKQYFKGGNSEGLEGTVARDVIQSVISHVA